MPSPSRITPADASIQISKTVTLLRKRPCPISSASAIKTPTSGRNVAPLRQTIDRLQADVSSSHRQRQQEALQRVSEALNKPCPIGQFAAICVHTGTSGASGDSSTFNSVVRHIEHTEDVTVVSLHPSRHDSLRSISDILASSVTDKLIVGIESTHLFHPDLLSDLIYLLSHYRSKNTGATAAIFGISYLTALHDCLNIGDMVMLRTTIVRMPTQYELFEGVVDILSQRQGVLFTRSVFELMYSHFIQHDTSLSMVLRTMRQMATLHFSNSKLSDLILLIDDNSPSSRDQLVKLFQQKEYLSLLDRLSSVRSLPKNSFLNNDNVRAQQYANCAYDLCKWKRNVSRLNKFTMKLDSIIEQKDKTEFADIHQLNDQSSSVHHALMFSAFLPHDKAQAQTTGAVYLTKAQKFIRTGQRADLKRILSAVVEHYGITSDITDTANTASMSPSWFTSHADLDDQKAEDQAFATRANELISLLENSNANSNGNIINQSNSNSPLPATPTSTPKTKRTQLTTPTSTFSARRRAAGAQAAREIRNQVLRANAVEAQQHQKQLPVGNVRDGVSRLLQDLYTRQKPLFMLVGHEIILFSDVSALQLAGGGLCSTVQPRHAIFTALRTPSKIFSITKSGEPCKVDPDIVIAFRILAQGGRLVSLYDWYQTFASSVTAVQIQQQNKQPEHEQEQNAQTNITSAELQARFARACSELELLGLLKYTNRKTDHVARLAYE